MHLPDPYLTQRHSLQESTSVQCVFLCFQEVNVFHSGKPILSTRIRGTGRLFPKLQLVLLQPQRNLLPKAHQPYLQVVYHYQYSHSDVYEDQIGSLSVHPFTYHIS